MTRYIIGAALIMLAPAAQAVDTNAMLASWLTAQANLKTWTADFIQTRSLKALTQPLTATGRVWFAAPDRFRWEVGVPTQTIAVKRTEELLIIYPQLQRVEKYSLADKKFGSWREALALLEAGFPRNREELEARFRLGNVQETPDGFALALRPRSSAARRFMREIHLTFQTNSLSLTATRITFSDGSMLRNEFLNPQKNVELPADLFAPTPPPDFQVIEPLRQ